MKPGVIRTARSFYDNTGDRRLTTCGDCGFPADSTLGDHAGACLTAALGPRDTALDIIRRAALAHEQVSMNLCRPEFDRAAIKETSRGSAFGTAVKRRWLRHSGSVKSTDPATKNHRISTYESLIYRSQA